MSHPKLYNKSLYYCFRHNDERSHNYQESRPAGRGGRGGHQQRPPQQHPSHGPREMEEITVDMKNISVSAQNREEQFRGKNSK